MSIKPSNYMLKCRASLDDVKPLLPEEDIAIIRDALSISKVALRSAKFKVDNFTTKVTVNSVTFKIFVWGDKQQIKGFLVHRFDGTEQGKLFKAVEFVQRTESESISKRDIREFNNSLVYFVIPVNNSLIADFYLESGKVERVEIPIPARTLKRFKPKLSIVKN